MGRLGATMFRVPLAVIDHLAVNELRVLMPALAVVGAFLWFNDCYRHLKSCPPIVMRSL